VPEVPHLRVFVVLKEKRRKLRTRREIPMFNKVILGGYMVTDVVMKYTPQGTPVATLRVAVNSGKNKSGVKETLFIDSVVFGKTAENCDKYLKKGDPVLIEGKLRERKWESEGEKKSKMEVLVESVRFLPKKRNDTEKEGESFAEYDETPF
jgi:single-strand DNA-binding protein